MYTTSRKLLITSAKWPLLAVFALALAISGPAAAEKEPKSGMGPGMGQGPQQAQIQEFMKTRQELQQIQQKLAQIEQKTIQSNPELKKKQTQFQQQVFEAMKDKGHTPQADLKELQSIRGKAQDKDLSKQERQSLAQEFQQKASSFKQAQRETLKDDDISQQREVIQKELLSAMKEQNPETPQLLQRAQQLSAKLQQIQKQVKQQQGGG